MAATQTLPQVLSSHNSRVPLVPRFGTVTLFGYGIRVAVERGHLMIQDGLGRDRREGRFARVGHGLRRLVVIGSDGTVSLSAIRWLADQDASLVMLERDGSVLLTTGPVRPSDVRLRRAQALALESGTALQIVRELISRKLAGQERVIRGSLNDSVAVDTIARARSSVTTCKTVPEIRQFESKGASAYWAAWRNVPIQFPKNDFRRVPEHWRTFGSRHSPLTGSARLAVNPPNAVLNYLYALLESESRLALAALGLDPGMGMLHVDSPVRDSLACDLMEVVRPQVDAYLLEWIGREPWCREWFFERADGNCRLMGAFAAQLSETTSTWARAVAPVAEWISRTLWSNLRKPARQVYPPTRLTQNMRRRAKGGPPATPSVMMPPVPRICRTCGTGLSRGENYCAKCAIDVSRQNLMEVAKLGRVATHQPKAEALRAATQRRQAAARKAWNPSYKPEWLDEKTYRDKIQPRLKAVTVPTIQSALEVSEPYATSIRSGRRIPHPRHWMSLARLAGLMSSDT